MLLAPLPCRKCGLAVSRLTGACSPGTSRCVSVAANKLESVDKQPFFDPRQAPRGIYRGDNCDLVYDLRPVPADPEPWITEFQRNLDKTLADVVSTTSSFVRQQQVTLDATEQKLVCTVTVKSSESVETLSDIDDAVFDALSHTASEFEFGPSNLEHKLQQVRARRRDNWPNASP